MEAGWKLVGILVLPGDKDIADYAGCGQMLTDVDVCSFMRWLSYINDVMDA